MTITQARPATTLSPLELLDRLGDYVAEMAGLLAPADPALTERRYELLELSDDLEIWAIHWPQDQGLELHDHGGSAGALWVVDGALEEHFIGTDGALGQRRLDIGGGAAFGPTYIHDVVNRQIAPATSVHAYSPPMPSMTFYRQEGARLVVDRAEYRADPTWAPVSGVDRQLAEARQRLVRVDPPQAQTIAEAGGLLIDIRPAAQRAEFGEIPGALIIERNNLEWRLDPDGSHRIPEAADPARPVVIFCQEGYASSLAAASLLEVGRTHATDLIGGFKAWREAGLPTTPPA